MDLCKAFDIVNHKLLLDKLHFYGKRGCILSWFASYLTNRTQSTHIKIHQSNKRHITLGVPQGSV